MKNAHKRITLSTRPSKREGGPVSHTILVDGVEYTAFATYEIAAMVRHCMIDATEMV